MGTAYLQLDNGLVVPSLTADQAPVERALKRHDPSLQLGQVNGVWKVYTRWGGEPHQCSCVLSWRDPDGTPRPLTFGIVDAVMALDRNTRERLPSAEELERKRQDELGKHREQLYEALESDYRNSTISTSLPRTKNRGNWRWKAEQEAMQKRRRARGLDY